MGRKAKDPKLNQLAKELQEHQFVEVEGLEDAARERMLATELRCVVQMPNFKTWAVRMYIGGLSRCIGYTDDLTAACRFADMAACRFWKYRVRGACPPVDSDLNFGVAHAKTDCANELQIMHLLDRIENYLRSLGCIDTDNDPVANRRARDERRTVRHDMIALFDDVMIALRDIKKALDVLVDQHQSCKQISQGEGGVELFKRDRNVVDVDTMTDFTVHCGPEKVVIQIPTRRENGEDIILPEGLALIERTKLVMKQRAELVDIFSPPQTQPTQPVYES